LQDKLKKKGIFNKAFEIWVITSKFCTIRKTEKEITKYYGVAKK